MADRSRFSEKPCRRATRGQRHQHFTLADQMTVMENIALGTAPMFSPRLDRQAANARIGELSRQFGLEVDPRARITDLSVGERQRVEILKALYREARILILDEPTAVLTPLETEALFSTLRKLIAGGLSIIFISHKLNEVMAISDRVLVLRAGRLAGERLTSQTTRQELAALMVGDEIAEQHPAPARPGEILLEMRDVSAAAPSGIAIENAGLALRAGEITGIAGVSGNGQSVIAGLIEGTLAPRSGTLAVKGEAVGKWSAREALAHRIGRIPEDRHATGMIGDMSVTENVISEAYRSPRFCRHG
ncbi:MAG: ATP-binding cassette domain-containing protein, partial [Nitratireductor sp.]|nr:ATP-binding cassette domain-containing protein [Nitratireductor sp.]